MISLSARTSGYTGHLLPKVSRQRTRKQQYTARWTPIDDSTKNRNVMNPYSAALGARGQSRSGDEHRRERAEGDSELHADEDPSRVFEQHMLLCWVPLFAAHLKFPRSPVAARSAHAIVQQPARGRARGAEQYNRTTKQSEVGFAFAAMRLGDPLSDAL